MQVRFFQPHNSSSEFEKARNHLKEVVFGYSTLLKQVLTWSCRPPWLSPRLFLGFLVDSVKSMPDTLTALLDNDSMNVRK